MPCTEYEDLILEYCGDTLGTDERARVEAHAAGCPACRAFLEIQRELDSALARAVGKPAPSRAFRETLMRRIDAAPHQRFGRLSLLLDFMGYASTAVIGGAALVQLPHVAEYAGWAAVAAYAAVGMWLGIRFLRDGQLPGER